MKNLGELLKELRGKESLREASKRIGISHTYLDTIEKGIDKRSGSPVKPTPDTLRLISNAYNYDYEKLMVIAGYINPFVDSVKRYSKRKKDLENKKTYRKWTDKEKEEYNTIEEFFEENPQEHITDLYQKLNELRKYNDEFEKKYLSSYSKKPQLTDKDEKDIAKRMKKLKKDLMQGSADGEGLNFMGEPMSEEAIESLLEALEHAERIATLANKKYTPKKYREKD